MVNNKLQKMITSLIYIVCMFALIGFCGSYELDTITLNQFLLRIAITIVVSKSALYILSKVNFVITKIILKY